MSTKDEEESADVTVIRQSERVPKPTEKMLEYQEWITSELKTKWTNKYDSWKTETRTLRDLLKTDCILEELQDQKAVVERIERQLLEQFEDLKRKDPIDKESVRKMDACVAVTAEMVKIVNERLSEIDTFDEETEIKKLENVKHAFITQSVFSEPVSHSSDVSRRSYISEKAADAAAELAVKETELRMIDKLRQETTRRAELEKAELEYKRFIAEQQDQLKKMALEREVEMAGARFKAYKSALKIEVEESQPAEPASHITNTDKLVKAFADSVNLNRLPVPEPSVFMGNPLTYVEWKTSFEMLIERRGIPPNEKIYYLKKYVGGQAKKALEGFYLSSNESAFKRAQEVLDERYGHPFVLQRAYREKLDNWPKVGPKDPMALRDFADFLQGCQDAIPHVPSLSVLNDCIENQKLLKKLPDWCISRWNREVTEALGNNDNYPKFNKFVKFLVKEARVACNPVSSLSALQGGANMRPAKEKSRQRVEVLATSTAESKPECVYCTGAHHVTKCQRFLALSLEDKRAFIRRTNTCYGCLGKNHRNKDCRKKHTCATCKGRHPTCLHEERQKEASQAANLNPCAPVFNANSGATATSSCGFSQIKGRGTSMIVPVWVSHSSNRSNEVLTYALLDTQSDTTFILEELATSLQAPQWPIKLNLSTMTSQNTIIDSFRICDLEIRGFNSTERVAINQTYTRNFIPADRSHIPQRKTAQSLPHLNELADVIPPLQSCDVGLLIGYNCPQALAPRQILMGEQSNDPYAVRTPLGWSIVGCSNPSMEKFDKGISHRIVTKEVPACTPRDLIKVFEKDFKIDEERACSQEDLMFLHKLETGVTKTETGHIEMPLPFKGIERPEMPNNKSMALGRLEHLKRKFKRDSKYHDNYKAFMAEILSRGDAEKSDATSSKDVWYIPHHGVYHPKKPEKLRVVFDCSAQFKGISLNQHLLTGPDLTNGLAGVLCRFRRYPIAVMCDVEKMFHQFKVPASDRDFLRFLWWEDGDITKSPTEYRMTVHLFGAASSPGCANYGIKYLAKSLEDEYPKGSAFVTREFYVDDGLASAETVTEATTLADEARKLCAKGGLRLHKFVCNSPEVLDSVPITERAQTSNMNLQLEKIPLERALGLQWNMEQDEFTFPIQVRDQANTRRTMLSLVASIFDPLGLLSPFTLTGKCILQEMCKNGVGWDDPLPTYLQMEWEDWIKDINNLQEVKIPRCLRPQHMKKPKVELHHFSDACTKGYGQCTYIRYIEGNKVHCSLLIAKSRVAPQKIVTIPRLELTAAVLSVKMSQFLRDELDLDVAEEHFWTDSKVVLGYINNEARRFHVFVANRVQAIRNTTSPEQWHYVSSENNPADHASRGLSAHGLISSIWLRGPSYLWEEELELEPTVDSSLKLGDPEVRATTSLRTTGRETATKASLVKTLTERFSSWYTVVSVVARIQRLAEGVKGTQPSTVEERKRAEISILRFVQEDAFNDTFNDLKGSRTLPKSNNLYPLNPTVRDGLLCVGGRLRKADLSEPFKHPIILPKNGHVTTLILRHAHEKAKHQGRGMTLNFLRSNGYWILGGNKAVSQYIRNCVVCRKLRRPTEIQQMADLPEDRVQPSPPFLYCGMDCFGPFISKQGRKESKRYGLLFTCMCTRAIHVEMIDDMSTDAFIQGLRCFIAIRGTVRQLRADQGTNFIGARNEFKRAIDIDKMASFLNTKQCDFVFNAPSSSHTGGVWERQIRSVRSVLDSILLLCPGRLDDSSLRTLFYEVMSIVNCRPLTAIEVDNHVEPLTPNHILTAKSEIPLPPPGEFTKEDLCLRKRWRRVQYLLEQFWARWKKEYLTQICLRQKWHKPQRNVKVDDIVLVKDAETSRNQWPLARVTEVSVDDDGLVRRAKVTLAKGYSRQNSVLERSVHKLVLLLEQ